MSAQEIIDQIKELSPSEQARVAQFLTHASAPASHKPNQVSVVTGADGLPLIRAQGGVITSDLVHDIESQTP